MVLVASLDTRIDEFFGVTVAKVLTLTKTVLIRPIKLLTVVELLHPQNNYYTGLVLYRFC